MAKPHFGEHQFFDPIVGVAATSSSHLVILSQLNEVRNGKFFKDAIRAVATSNVDIARGGIANGQTVDGVTLATGDRVLLTAQTTASQNGIYVVPSSGAASRAADMAAGVASAGFNFNVTEGTTYHDTRWYVASDKGSDVVGTNSLTIPQDTTGGSYTADNNTLELVGSEFGVKDEGITPTQLATSVAGAGLAGGAGTSLAVQVDGSTIEINGSNQAQVKDAGISAAKLASDAVETAKILDANVTTAKLADDAVTTAKITDANVTTAKLADANVTTAKIADNNVTTGKVADAAITTAKLADSGVTSAKINDAAITPAKLGSGVRGKYTDIGDGSTTFFQITHGLGTRRVNVIVYDNTNYDTVDVLVRRNTTNHIELDFGSYVPASADIHVEIIPLVGDSL